MNEIENKIGDVIFVSYYTANGQYPLLANKLKASLEKFHLNFELVKLRPISNWLDGVSMKADFLLNMLLKHRKSVVWLDIDTEIWQFPHLLFGNHDFAIYNWIADASHHLSGKIPFDPGTKRLICSGGVQKYGYTIPSIELLYRWNQLLRKGRGEDDPVLDKAFNQYQPALNCLWLPKIYNRMDKHTEHWSLIDKSTVVINHDYTAGRHGANRALGT